MGENICIMHFFTLRPETPILYYPDKEDSL
jgi:hypothetical protein